MRSVAEILKQNGRLGDHVFRYGGEEFLVVLPEQSAKKAILAMERRRDAVVAAKIEHPKSDTADVVTISVGIAVFDKSRDEEIEGLVKRADSSLYEAKRSGRNTIKCNC